MDEKEFKGICESYLIHDVELKFMERMEEFKEDGFGQGFIESPIERMFYASFFTLCQLNNIRESEPEASEKVITLNGVSVEPQKRIGRYRVDFLVKYINSAWLKKSDDNIWDSKEIIVECDSQEWHERTEKERRYEKKRDRYLSKMGYQVFHYTGKEIMDDAFRVAAEVLGWVIGYNIDTPEKMI